MLNTELEAILQSFESENKTNSDILVHILARIKDVIKRGANIHCQASGWTALHVAVFCQNKKLVRWLVKRGANPNLSTSRGSGLHLAVKNCYPEIVAVLVLYKKTDTNLPMLCKLHAAQGILLLTPINFVNILYTDQRSPESLNMLRELLRYRSPISKTWINSRLKFYHEHHNDSDKINNTRLFLYTISMLIGQHVTDMLGSIKGIFGESVQDVLYCAFANLDATRDGRTLPSGAAHEHFLLMRIMALFDLIFKMEYLNKEFSFQVGLDKSEVLRLLKYELKSELETFKRCMDIRAIPYSRGLDLDMEPVYRAVTQNLIKRISKLPDNREYSMANGWAGHAVYVNFMRRGDFIFVRIDNLNQYEMSYHQHKEEDGVLFIRPRIIARLPIDQLDNYFDYFLNLVRNFYALADRSHALENIFYRPDSIEVLEGRWLEDEFPWCTAQAFGNCYTKSQEPGLRIRLGDKLLKLISIHEKAFISQRVDEFLNINFEIDRFWMSEFQPPVRVAVPNEEFPGPILTDIDDVERAADEGRLGIYAIKLFNQPLGDQGIRPLFRLLRQQGELVHRLKELNLSYTGLTFVGINSLVNALGDIRLKSLKLKGNPIGDQGAQALARFFRVNTTLTEVDLRGIHFPGDDQIGQLGIEAIVNAIKLNPRSAIRILDLWGNRIGDEGAHHIAELLLHNSSVCFLGLGRCQIGRVGAQYLAGALTQMNSQPHYRSRPALSIDLRYSLGYVSRADAAGIDYFIEVIESNNPYLINLNVMNNGIPRGKVQRLIAAFRSNEKIYGLALSARDLGSLMELTGGAGGEIDEIGKLTYTRLAFGYIFNRKHNQVSSAQRNLIKNIINNRLIEAIRNLPELELSELHELMEPTDKKQLYKGMATLPDILSRVLKSANCPVEIRDAYHERAFNYLEGSQSQMSSFSSAEESESLSVIDQPRAKPGLSVSKLLEAFEQWELNQAILQSLAEESTMESKQRMTARAQHFGFSCDDVERDGRCFYYALIQQLQRINPELYDNMTVQRCIERIATHMIEYQLAYNSFIQGVHGKNLDEFIDTLLNNTGEFWADQIMIMAAAREFNVTVAIVRNDDNPPNILRRSEPEGIVYLGYEVGVHYQSLTRDMSLEPAEDLDAHIEAAEIDHEDLILSGPLEPASITPDLAVGESSSRSTSFLSSSGPPPLTDISDVDGEQMSEMVNVLADHSIVTNPAPTDEQASEGDDMTESTSSSSNSGT